MRGTADFTVERLAGHLGTHRSAGLPTSLGADLGPFARFAGPPTQPQECGVKPAASLHQSGLARGGVADCRKLIADGRFTSRPIMGRGPLKPACGARAANPVMLPIHIIGGGLAGSEAAWQAARAGHRAVLHEMRPHTPTAAHRSDRLAELVCSNSLKSDQPGTAPWLLKQELRRMGSLLIEIAGRARVPG